MVAHPTTHPHLPRAELFGIFLFPNLPNLVGRSALGSEPFSLRLGQLAIGISEVSNVGPPASCRCNRISTEFQPNSNRIQLPFLASQNLFCPPSPLVSLDPKLGGQERLMWSTLRPKFGTLGDQRIGDI